MGLYSENRFKKLLAESVEEAPEVTANDESTEAPDVTANDESVEAPEVSINDDSVVEEAAIDELLAMLD